MCIIEEKYSVELVNIMTAGEVRVCVCVCGVGMRLIVISS